MVDEAVLAMRSAHYLSRQFNSPTADAPGAAESDVGAEHYPTLSHREDVFIHHGYFSAFGSDQPTDVALGTARRYRSLASATLSSATNQSSLNEQLFSINQTKKSRGLN